MAAPPGIPVSAGPSCDAQGPNSATRLIQRMMAPSRGLLFLRIFAFAAVIPLLMRLRVAQVAAIVESGRKPQPADPELVKRIVAYVEIAIRKGQPLVRSTCLTRGLARYYFLRRAGLDVSLHFGIGRTGKEKEFSGHCWLMKEGQPYLETQDPRLLYADMYCISRGNGQKAMGSYAFGRGRWIRS